MSVEAVNERLDGRLLQVAQIRGRLARLVAKDHRVGVDETEGVDDDFTFHTLNGIDYHGHGSLGQGLETLLSVDIDAREPAAETRMRVIPTDDHLWSENKVRLAPMIPLLIELSEHAL